MNDKKINKCCKESNLKWIRSGSCFPFEVWECSKCNNQFDIELIRDFENKELR